MGISGGEVVQGSVIFIAKARLALLSFETSISLTRLASPASPGVTKANNFLHLCFSFIPNSHSLLLTSSHSCASLSFLIVSLTRSTHRQSLHFITSLHVKSMRSSVLVAVAAATAPFAVSAKGTLGYALGSRHAGDFSSLLDTSAFLTLV